MTVSRHTAPVTLVTGTRGKTLCTRERAIAVAELDGPDLALAEIDRLTETLDGYHAFHAARADLLRRHGRSGESRAAYDRAIRLAGNPAERAYLTRRRDQLVR